MDSDNATVLFTGTAIITTAITGLVNAWGIIGNIVIIFIIARTPNMRGFSGALMINHAVADVIQESVSQIVVLLFAVGPRMVQLNIYLRLALFSLSGVVSHSVSALSVNLYLAICRQQQYKRLVTWKRVFAFMACSWAINIAISSLYHVVPSFYTVDLNSRSDIPYMDITPSNCWFYLLLVLNIVVIPICTAATCYLRIRSFMKCPTMSSMGPNNMNKVKLSQMIHIITIIYFLTFIPVFIIMSAKVQMQGVKTVIWAVNSSYYIIKLFLYLKLYKPFRETAKAICCNSCQNRLGPTQQGQDAIV
ncbi:mu-type opioid receptor-like [Haliotis rufescens]|uniref:mu-type opioid receptor-like n=1 Tax=Haliotis rufescens TaxID=6454 RepID=UPI00201E9837|nr:mu-type opioid receptor-like [Haliotis rufescens]